MRFGGEPRPVACFTDGAVEGSTVTCGGVIIDGTRKEFFGLLVPDNIADHWRATVGDQCIGQAEVAPVVWAKRTWWKVMSGRRVLVFIDNDSARHSLIKCYSPVNATARLLWEMLGVDSALGAVCWYARVPSESNIADEPSRLEYGGLLDKGFVQVEPVLR